MASGVDNPALSLVISACGAALTILLGLLITIALAKVNSVTAELKEIVKAFNVLYNDHTKTAGVVQVHDEAIRGLQAKTLTVQMFEAATNAQNDKLRRIEDDVKSTSTKVDNINQGLIARPGYSSSETPAARVPYRPPPR